MSPIIGMVATGGTIAEKRHSEVTDKHRRHLTGRELVKQTGVTDSTDWIIKDLLDLSSSSLSATHILEISLAIEELRNDGCDSVIVTVGTDTLEEVAYGLACLVPADARVVITGSMFASSEAEWDGPANIQTAVNLATVWRAPWAVLVVFAGKAFSPAEVVKASPYVADAFESPAGPLAILDTSEVNWLREIPRFKTLVASSIRAQVDIVTLGLGSSPEILDLSTRRAIDGLVIVAFGAGHWPPSLNSRLRELHEAGFPTIISSRCRTGLKVQSTTLGTWETDWVAGVTWTSLTPAKARIRLILELSQDANF